MTPSTVPSIGETETILVPARPNLQQLIESDNGKGLIDARKSETGIMLQHALCGLLYPDGGHLSDEQKRNFDWDLESVHDRFHLAMLAPKKVLAAQSLDRLTSTGSAVIAGLAYAPQEMAHTRDVVRTVLDRSEVLSNASESPEISIVFQGGARITNEEYIFSKLVGKQIALHEHAPKKFTTGGGRGIMRGPHSGAAELARERGGFDDTLSCGVSCGKIIAAEPPNSLIDKLAVFEQIERRLEAFTRSGQLTVFFPGGTGTFEELLYVLAVLMESKNKGIHYTFLMAGDETKREYYDIILKTLEKTLGAEVVEQTGIRDRICIGKPEEVAKRIVQVAEEAQKARKIEMLLKQDPVIRADFHGGIHIPSGLRVPYKVTRENVREQQLHREQSVSDQIIALRRFTYTVTLACVSDKENQDVAKNGPYEVSGDPDFIHSIDDLMQYFVATGRMNGGAYKQPYKIVA